MYRLIDDTIPVWGEPDPRALDQLRNCAKQAHRVALMADNHLGYAMPIGGVAAYKDKVSPSGVGFDIGCGNRAVCLGKAPADFDVESAMDLIFRELSFGLGRKNRERVEHPIFDDDPAWAVPVAASVRGLAQEQFGTIGSGNHYVDLQLDEMDRLWCAVHFGSRGFGHRIATYFVEAGGGTDDIFVDPVLLDVNSDLGAQYILAMRLAGRYAYAARDWVTEKVASLIGATIESAVHVHHNFAWEEPVEGEQMWVVRKGATPLFPGDYGYIGGSMGDDAYIVQGIQSKEAEIAMHSAPHGAGRAMSRTQAAGKRGKWGAPRQGGAITRDMMMDWLKRKGVVLRGAGVDESPQCYKRLADVLGHHSGVLRIVHTLRPIGVAMAGENEHDPFRD